MGITMKISEGKCTQICAALAKAQQDIERIQAAGAVERLELEQLCRELLGVVQDLCVLIGQ